MIGYIIGLVLGILVFLFQNFKPTSFGFRILFLLLTIAFLWGISYAHLGYWQILVMPIGETVLCLISAICFPYGGTSAQNGYEVINGRNYYAELRYDEKIGKISAPGFKQTYDRIISGILFKIVDSQEDLVRFGNLLYSKNFYPISIHTKNDVMDHINMVINETSRLSKNGDAIQKKARSCIELLFNAYVSVMSLHEEATDRINELRR